MDFSLVAHNMWKDPVDKSFYDARDRANVSGALQDTRNRTTEAYQRSEKKRQGLIDAYNKPGTQAEKAMATRDVYGTQDPENLLSKGVPLSSVIMSNTKNELEQAKQLDDAEKMGEALNDVRVTLASQGKVSGAELPADVKSVMATKYAASFGVSEEQAVKAIDSTSAAPDGAGVVYKNQEGREFFVDLNKKIHVLPQMREVGMGGRGSTPYFQFKETPEGIIAGNARTGEITRPTLDGKPVIGSVSSPELQSEISKGKAAGKTVGTMGATAQVELPQTIQDAAQAVGLVDDLLAHPGMKMAVGKSAMVPVGYVPGTDTKAFRVRLDQLKGGQFLQAYKTLKGGGQITEIEGEKATAAMSRMDTANTEDEFVTAAREYQKIISKGVERAKEKASLVGGNQAPASGRTIVRTGRTKDGRKVIQHSDGTIEYGN